MYYVFLCLQLKQQEILCFYSRALVETVTKCSKYIKKMEGKKNSARDDRIFVGKTNFARCTGDIIFFIYLMNLFQVICKIYLYGN